MQNTNVATRKELGRLTTKLFVEIAIINSGFIFKVCQKIISLNNVYNSLSRWLMTDADRSDAKQYSTLHLAQFELCRSK